MKSLTLDDIKQLNSTLDLQYRIMCECKEILKTLNEFALDKERGFSLRYGTRALNLNGHIQFVDYETALRSLMVRVAGICIYASSLEQIIDAQKE